jgi:hypothetical protein
MLLLEQGTAIQESMQLLVLLSRSRDSDVFGDGLTIVALSSLLIAAAYLMDDQAAEAPAFLRCKQASDKVEYLLELKSYIRSLSIHSSEMEIFHCSSCRFCFFGMRTSAAYLISSSTSSGCRAFRTR